MNKTLNATWTMTQQDELKSFSGQNLQDELAKVMQEEIDKVIMIGMLDYIPLEFEIKL